MSAQLFFVNTANHRIQLKLKRKDSKHHWHLQRESANSLSLPISANHPLKYKLKHGDKVIAEIFIDHDGLVERIINHGSKFSVTTNDIHYRRHGQKHLLSHTFEIPSIFIVENHDLC